MIKPLVTLMIPLLCSPALFAGDTLNNEMKNELEQAATGKHRSAANIARNPYRHPVETLTFFGLEKDMTVIEISPGGMWYSEILAPVLQAEGQYIAATFDAEVQGQPPYYYKLTKDLQTRFTSDPIFSKAKIARFSPPASIDLGAPASADMVVTFRNTHGWVRNNVADAAFNSFFEVLKPGGILGVVQHRGPAAKSDFTGYLTEEEVIALAQKAGFVLEARSEINANPKDTKDHPEGVWTLPPSLRLGEDDRDKYLAIGESDRMTLKFRKPQ